MRPTGLHILLSYQCTFECDHCFVWGSPFQSGTLTLGQVREILRQAQELSSIEWIYFEGGEPFLYHPILLRSVQAAADLKFKVGLVTNAYWATGYEDALEWLKPLSGLVQDLSISSDLFHYAEMISSQVKNARAAAESLGFPVGTISVAQPESQEATFVVGQLPLDLSGVMFRGRAAEKLAARAVQQAWDSFVECPYEDLAQPGRLHIDPLGFVHTCQGISLGNLFEQSLPEICAAYHPDSHPITGPLLAGGPAELVRRYNLPHAEAYADACHLCYTARLALREQFPDILLPDQMYGVVDTGQ